MILDIFILCVAIISFIGIEVIRKKSEKRNEEPGLIYDIWFQVYYASLAIIFIFILKIVGDLMGG